MNLSSGPPYVTSFLVAMCSAVLVDACSGSTDSSAGGPNASDACAAIAKARCAQLEACSGGKGVLVRFGDEATCEARHALQCSLALGANGTSATPSGVEGCASALSSESCSDFLDNKVPVACQPRPGALSTGAACMFSAQCSTTFCTSPADAPCGACAQQPAAGSHCTDSADCGRDLICAKESSTCAAPGSQGASCMKGVPCGAGLSCVRATAMASGTCQPAGTTVGAACDPKRVMAPECDRELGLYCDATTKKCAAVSYVAAGRPCGVTASGVAVCTGGADCFVPAGQNAGMCVAPAADGAPCNTAAGPGCLAPAKCVTTGGDAGVSGTCQLPNPQSCE